MAASHASAFANFIVSQHSTKSRAPVYSCFGQVGKAIIQQYLLLLFLAHTFPFRGIENGSFVTGCINLGIALCFESRNQSTHWLSLIRFFIIPRIKELYKSPLGPFVIIRVAGTHLTVPIERKPDSVELLAVTCQVYLGGYGRMSTGLYGILLGRQPISIVAHRVQNVKTFQSFIPRKYIRCNIAKRMSDMQSGSRRIWEHIENIIFRFPFNYFCFEHFFRSPLFLPFFLYFTKIIFHVRCKLFLVNHLSSLACLALKCAKVVFLKDLRTYDCEGGIYPRINTNQARIRTNKF